VLFGAALAALFSIGTPFAIVPVTPKICSDERLTLTASGLDDTGMEKIPIAIKP